MRWFCNKRARSKMTKKRTKKPTTSECDGLTHDFVCLVCSTVSSELVHKSVGTTAASGGASGSDVINGGGGGGVGVGVLKLSKRTIAKWSHTWTERIHCEHCSAWCTLVHESAYHVPYLKKASLAQLPMTTW